jgi:hypothetical protein
MAIGRYYSFEVVIAKSFEIGSPVFLSPFVVVAT